jgi:hypothetical protein
MTTDVQKNDHDNNEYDLTSPQDGTSAEQVVNVTESGVAVEENTPVEVTPQVQDSPKAKSVKAKSTKPSTAKGTTKAKSPAKGENTMPVAPPKAKAPAKGTKSVVEKSDSTRGLANSAVRVLHLLSKSEGGLTRTQLAAKTGVKRGWSKLLGAPTKEGGSSRGLEGRGLVRGSVAEGVRGLVYTITAAGRKELAKSGK